MISIKNSFFLVSLAPLCLCAESGQRNDEESSTPTTIKGVHPQITSSPFSYEVDTSFLYWYGKQNGNEYVKSGQSLSGLDTAAPGRVYGPEYSSQPGFKLGFTLQHQNYGWDVTALYTWYQGKGHRTVTPNNTILLPILGYAPSASILDQVNGGSQAITSAPSQWLNKFHAIDITWGKTIAYSNRFTLHPSFGLKATYQTQKFMYDFVTGIGTNYNKNQQRIAGAGLRAGVVADWLFTKYVGISASGALDLVWSSTSSKFISRDDITTDTLPMTNTVIGNQKYYANNIVPVFELFLGLVYRQDFSSSLRKFSLKAGWEQQTWLFSNGHSTTLPDGSLNLQGLTLKALFDF